MAPRKIVVIGGVAAGPSAAAKARRTDEEAEIVLFEESDYISYSRCGLPFYVSGLVSDREDLVMRTPQAFKTSYNIDVYTKHQVTGINTEDKKVSVADLENQEEREWPFDSLVIATGTAPVVSSLPGGDLPHIYQLRTIPQADMILNFVRSRRRSRVVVAGGGLVGLEMADSLVAQGMKVTVVEALDQILPSLDFEMARIVEKHLADNGVQVIKGVPVRRFSGDPKSGVEEVLLENGETLPADMVLLSLGGRPEVTLARKAGVKIGPTGAIAVDAYMCTSIPDIYAAGDCCESYNIITGQPIYSPQGSIANRQGRTAGHNAAGGSSRFKGVLGGSIAKIFRLTAAKTGLNEKEAQKFGFDYTAVHLHPLNHASVYPEAEALAIKVIVDNKTEKLLGAQIVGREGADKRIDVFSTAIYSGLKCGELFDVDFAYSPPYAPAKDPVAVSGMVADNALHSGVVFVTPQWLYENYGKVGDEILLVDVAEPDELAAHGYLEGAVNIPLSQLRKRTGDLDKNMNILVYCRQGRRGYLAAKILVNKGFKHVMNLSGGFLTWPYEEKITHSEA